MSGMSSPRAAPTPRQRLRRARPLIVIALAVVASALLAAIFTGRQQAGLLDPAAATPEGSRALAELLRDQGVHVVAVDTIADAQAAVGPGTTMFVTVPDRLPAARLDDLVRRASAAVLVEPTAVVLDTVLPAVTDAGRAEVASRDPGCDLPAARAAGSAHAGGVSYDITDGNIEDGANEAGPAVGCYAAGGRPSLVRAARQGVPVTVVGTSAPFTNERLDEDGNAALTMRLLGEQATLVWYRPAVSDALADDGSSLLELVPAGWKWAAAQLAIAVAVLALWRGRRLGPVVTEPLPVVVRAAEAVEGRARLYRQVQARDRAAESLREVTRAQLRRPLGLARGADAHALVAAAAGRTGRADIDIGALLFGAPPPDDEALVRLADDLDRLRTQIAGHPSRPDIRP